VAVIASSYLSNVRTLAQVREYHVIVGTTTATDPPIELLVASHGVGGGGASVCFHELFAAGVDTIVRVGTAGSLQDHLREGSIIVASGAVREDLYVCNDWMIG